MHGEQLSYELYVDLNKSIFENIFVFFHGIEFDFLQNIYCIQHRSYIVIESEWYLNELNKSSKFL